jgi:hypothetical protein
MVNGHSKPTGSTAVDWVQIKADWDLSVTNAEWEALQEMLGTCDTKPFIKQFRNA